MSTITNYSALIFVINDDVRAIRAIYEKQEKEGEREVPRTVFKTFDASIKVGDIVLVPSTTRHGITTVKVVEADVEFDITSQVKVDWIMGVVDVDAYEQTKSMEDAAIAKVRAAEKTAAKAEIRKKMLAHMDDAAVASLQITHAKPGDGGPVIEQVATTIEGTKAGN